MKFKLICNSTPQSLLELLRQEGGYIPAYCGGKGICGKCKVRFVKEAPFPLEEERECLTEKELKEGWRLACMAKVSGEVEIEVPLLEEDRIEAETGFCTVSESMEGGKNQTNRSIKGDGNQLLESFKKYNNKEQREISLEDTSEEKKKKFLYEEQKDGYIVAVDIGTTTIAAAKIESQTKKVTETAAAVNHQRLYGADVIARMEASNLGRGKELQKMILTDIGKLLVSMKLEGDTPVIVSGNTTMQHLLQGYSCETLGVAPYTPVDISLHQYKNMTMLPGISTFVGADIVSGIIACGMHKSEKISILVDIGTNGEMAIGNKEKILVASTAAGPAFEGGNIRWGVAGVPGAISAITIGNDDDFSNKDCRMVAGTTPFVAILKGRVTFETIGAEKPIGICGSGVIEMTYELLKNGFIDETGLLKEPYFDSGYPLTEDIVFTVKDIREVQLAKSAIRAGIEVLMREYGAEYDEIDQLYLAGGFGKHLNLDKSVGIGLLPKELDGKMTAVGNTSLAGAVLFVTEEGIREDFAKVAQMAEEISLAENGLFQDLYMEHMFFPG